ncbi:MAG: hypothetical protein IT159_07995 [Bryobacterales bacterium]|nr:hypothetical protein [Bryobacterales bacterium]
MAAQARVFEDSSARADWAGKSGREAAGGFRLPPVPNESIYFYRKPIDNSGVVRLPDPKASARCWRWVAAATTVTLLLAGLLWPGAYSLLAGYQVESLKGQQETLRAELASLELEQARLVTPERLDQLAREQELIDPAPDQVVQLAPAPDGSLARNLSAK